MDKLLIFFIFLVLIIGVALIIIIHIISQKQTGLNRELYRKVWRAINNSAKTSDADSMQLGIIKADKLLDKAMQDYGVKGDTTGQRLKSRKGLWTKENAVWEAHKLRNQVAHAQNVTLNKSSFQRAMAGFESALIDLGAL